IQFTQALCLLKFTSLIIHPCILAPELRIHNSEIWDKHVDMSNHPDPLQICIRAKIYCHPHHICHPCPCCCLIR
ncbi:hypothetical protein FB45DRAFT_935684, partial [Roridomyces roridus]